VLPAGRWSALNSGWQGVAGWISGCLNMLDIDLRRQGRALAILNGLQDPLRDAVAERRQRVRVCFRRRIDIMLLDAAVHHKLRVDTQDISSRGMGFLCHRELQTGERFIVPLKMAGLSDKMVMCRVTHVRVLTGGLYCVGATFEQAVCALPQSSAPPEVQGALCP